MFPREISCALNSSILYTQTFDLATTLLINTTLLILLGKLY